MAGRNNRKNEVPVRRQLTMPETTTRARINPAGLAPPPHKVHSKRHRRIKVGGGLMARTPGLDIRYHPFT